MDARAVLAHPLLPVILIAIAGAIILVRHYDRTTPRRSLMQLWIRLLGLSARWLYAVMVGFDAGYLAYRKELNATQLELHNEAQLGPLLRSHIAA
jgi:hypothetical protein